MKTIAPKQLVSKLLGKRAAAPQADTSDWLKELPELPPIEALERVNARLKALALEEAQLSASAQLELLRTIDKQTRKYSALNQTSYISIGKMLPELDQRIWEAVYFYHHFLARGYQKFLQEHRAQIEAASPERLASMLSAAMYHSCTLVKWRHIGYQKPPEGLWKTIHDLYRLGEQSGLCDLDGMPPNPRNEEFVATYLAALMLDTVSFSGMSKKQIELIHRWLLSWTRRTPLSAVVDEAKHLFYVNLAEDRGARRIRSERLDRSATSRYWNTGQLMITLSRATGVINAGGEHAAKLCGPCSKTESLTMLEHVSKEWAAADYTRQRRRHARQPTMQKVSVCFGLQAIYGLLKGVQSALTNRLMTVPGDKGMSFEERVARHSIDKTPGVVALAWHAGDTCAIRNESASGFGLEVDEAQAAQLRIGMLISLVRRESGSDVILGVIRNMAAGSRGTHQIGIETLFHQPQPVLAIRLLGTHTSTETEILEQELSGVAHVQFGLLLPADRNVDGGRHSLIIPRSNYQENADYRIVLADKRAFTTRLAPVIAERDEWIQVGLVSG